MVVPLSHMQCNATACYPAPECERLITLSKSGVELSVCCVTLLSVAGDDTRFSPAPGVNSSSNSNPRIYYSPAQPASPFGKGDWMMAIHKVLVELVTEIIAIRCHGRESATSAGRDWEVSDRDAKAKDNHAERRARLPLKLCERPDG